MGLIGIQFLGTGRALSTKYYNTCFLLETDKGKMLVDGGGGNGILVQLENISFDLNELSHMFITHNHTDHILGCVWIIRCIAHNINENKYLKEFYIYGAEEVIKNLKTICLNTLNNLDISRMDKEIKFICIRDGERRIILDQEFTFFNINSTKTVQFGFKVSDKNTEFVFPGDEPLDKDCVHYFKNADWLIHEAYCLYRDREKYTPYKYNHSTALDACKNAEKFGVKNVILCHTEDDTLGKRKRLYTEEGKKVYKGNIFVPEDLEIIMFYDTRE